MGNGISTKPLKLAVAAALALTAAGAYAGEITLFHKMGFQGRNMTAVDAVPNLERSAFNEVASSIIVNDGTWEACTESNFRGRCAQLTPGQYGQLSRDLGFVASVRQIGGFAPSSGRIIIGPDSVAMSTPPVVVERAPVVVERQPMVIERQPVIVAESQPVIVAPADSARLPAGPRIVLYQHTQRGPIRAVDVTADTSNLVSRHFENRADAAFVTGGVWRLCDGPNGQGECFDYGPGTYPTLGTLNRRVESAYLISSITQPASIPPIASGRVVVYQYPNFGGPSAVIENGRAPDLDWTNFRYPAASMRVESGSWLVCPELGYQGECRVYDPGEYPTLGTPLERGIASARQVWRPEYSSLETYRFMGN